MSNERVTGVRIATGVREELNEFAAQAWRDGIVEHFADIREEPVGATKHPDADCPDPCPYCAAWRAERAAAAVDASLEARAEGALRAWRDTGSISDVADMRSWLAVVRAGDASNPEAMAMRSALTAVGFPVQDGEALDKAFARAWEWCTEMAHMAHGTSVGASRPTPADEDPRPRLTERDADDIELARAIRDTLREVTHAGAIERLEELLDVEKEAAARPGLTEEQIETLAKSFDAKAEAEMVLSRKNREEPAEWRHEAVSVAWDEAAALLRASRGETGPAPIDYPGVRDALRALAYAMCATQARDPEQKAQLQRAAEAHDALRYALGDKDPSGETGPADEPFEKIEQLPSGLTRTMHAAAQRPSTPPDLGPAPYRTTLATATTADEELRVTAASLRITVTDLGSVAHDPRATLHDGDPQKSATLAGGGTGND